MLDGRHTSDVARGATVGGRGGKRWDTRSAGLVLTGRADCKGEDQRVIEGN